MKQYLQIIIISLQYNQDQNLNDKYLQSDDFKTINIISSDDIIDSLSLNEQSNPVESSNLESCTCPQTKYDYNYFPLSQVNSGCIGGCGGSAFSIQYQNTTVQKLQVWWIKTNIVYLSITFFNNKTNTQGSIDNLHDKNVEQQQFTFSSGEYLINNLILTGNGKGTRLGQIEFETNLARTFTAGRPNNKYQFNVDKSYFAGLYGSSGTDIDRLGFILVKPFKSASIDNVSWPDIDSSTGSLMPNVRRVTLCNDTSVAQNQSYSFSRTKGKKQSMSIETSFEVGATMSVSTSIPDLVKVDSSYTWKLGQRHGRSVTEDTIETEVETIPVVVASKTRLVGQFRWTEGRVSNLPIEASMNVVFVDNTKHTFLFNGIFNETINSDFDGVQQEQKLKDDERCIGGGEISDIQFGQNRGNKKSNKFNKYINKLRDQINTISKTSLNYIRMIQEKYIILKSVNKNE